MYILFVAELLDILAKVPLSDGDPVVGKFLLRAVMVADDLALCVFSQRDAQLLSDACQKFYSRRWQLINVPKTEAVPYLNEESNKFSIYSERHLFLNSRKVLDATTGDKSVKKIRKTAHPITFSLYGSDLPAAWLFTYLGVVLHSFNDASEAWKARLNLGVKAWHSLRSTFCAFLYVPLDRVWHLTQSLVYSVYLYGAELWGPFVLHNEPISGSNARKCAFYRLESSQHSSHWLASVA